MIYFTKPIEWIVLVFVLFLYLAFRTPTLPWGYDELLVTIVIMIVGVFTKKEAEYP